MKTILIYLALYFLSLSIIQAQDVITKTDGTDIQSKVSEVTSNEVKYKRFDNPNGPTYSVLKTEVLLIRYENGTKEVFSTNISNSNSTNPRESKLPSNSISLEIIGGIDIFHSTINYERVFLKSNTTNLSLKIGAGLIDYYGFDGTIPLSVNWIIGKEKNYFDTSAGIEVTTFGDFFSTWTVGYRYQKPSKGFLFKANLELLYSVFDEEVVPTLGISLGYAF